MTLFIDPAPAEFQRRVRKALKYWHDSRQNEGLLDDLLITRRAAAGKAITRRQSTNLVLQRGLEELAVDHACEAELLELRFCTCLPVRETRQHVNYAESTIYVKQGRAIARLASILHRMELAALQERAARLEGRLGAPPALLVGVEAQTCQLSALLDRAQAPWLVSIEGIGGIGKTTLAAAVLRTLANTACFDDFGWVSAQVAALDRCGDVRPHARPMITSTAIVAALAQQLLPKTAHRVLHDTEAALNALRLRLQRCPHLIVVDNLDTVIDPQRLMPMLHSLANPSKFILTSRRRLISEPGVHLHCVPELSKADALLLLRHLAQEHELSPLAGCTDEQLEPIYAAVGGNPLALTFVVGQTHVRPLHAVLADLTDARTTPVETLFAFLLRSVWAGLGSCERRVLAAMPSAELHGLDAEGIGLMCGLNMAETAAALQRLVQASLVFTRGDLDGCRYLLHNLTRTFLHCLVMHWPHWGESGGVDGWAERETLPSRSCI